MDGIIVDIIGWSFLGITFLLLCVLGHMIYGDLV